MIKKSETNGKKEENQDESLVVTTCGLFICNRDFVRLLETSKHLVTKGQPLRVYLE